MQQGAAKNMRVIQVAPRRASPLCSLALKLLKKDSVATLRRVHFVRGGEGEVDKDTISWQIESVKCPHAL